MSGKKKIAYPIELPFTIQEPILLNNAIDKYQLRICKTSKEIYTWYKCKLIK